MFWIKENWFKLIIALGVLVIAGAIVYYFVKIIPAKDKADLIFKQQEQELKKNQSDLEKQRIQDNQTSLQECLDAAQISYDDLVKINSDKNGTYNSLEAQKFVESKYENDRNVCFKQYPVK